MDKLTHDRHDLGGIWGHSSPSTSHVIFSPTVPTAELLGDTLRAILARASNAGVPIKPVIGSYKGKLEFAFIVQAWDLGTFRPFFEGQESVLLLGAHDARDRRKATLVYLDGRMTELGTYGSVTEAEAKASEAWTYDPTQGLYFIARETWTNPYPHPGLGALG